MNLLKTFESRVSAVFDAAPEGYDAPFSFKKLAKQAAREMEAETYEIDGVDTAPALYTVLVSSEDDASMRSLYARLTAEISAFVESQAQAKGYVFVGQPLVRFMVDPSLKRKRFAVFAENVDAHTLARLRDEEEAFLSGSSGLGGAADQLQPVPTPTPEPAAPMAEPAAPVAGPLSQGAVKPVPVAQAAHQHAHAVPVAEPGDPQPLPADLQALTDEEFAPLVAPVADDASAGLNVIPTDFVEDDLVEGEVRAEEAYAQVMPAQPAPVPVAEPQPARARRHAHGAHAAQASADVPVTQRRATPAATPEAAAQPQPVTCLLVDRETGRTYLATAPATPIGRGRTEGGIVLHDPNVSRRHAELTFDGRSWHITDLDSTNGTLVNNVDVDTCILQDGDLITMGLMNLEFRES